MTTYRFQEVTRTKKMRIDCAGGCGKKLNRQRTFMQTINPFNKNADGSVKTFTDIWRELGVEAEQWKPVAVCRTCDPGAAS